MAGRCCGFHEQSVYKTTFDAVNKHRAVRSGPCPDILQAMLQDQESEQNDGRDIVYPVNRKPEWLKIKLNTNTNFKDLKKIMRSENLHTVCEEARCPNIHECWGEHRTATFMILGDTCTRRCRFCSVKTGLPRGIDLGEPDRVAQSVADMQLRHVVITMVNRDDLKDNGAGIVAATVRRIRVRSPETTVEILSSDMMGHVDSIRTACESRPEVMSHNIETVKRLTPSVRSRSTYERSLFFLRTAKEIDPETTTKSSIMLGLGETTDELKEAMDDLLANNVSILNLGQYLQPTRNHLPVQRYWTPEEFAGLRDIAMEKGFEHCHSGPLVRSSYQAGEQYRNYRKNVHPLYRDNPELV
ncbi:MAG: lipoyl synthase [Spirochaetaceae bacterium]|nr:MAG: lipoyl synthase [Spirochaetaceae bacterium]